MYFCSKKTSEEKREKYNRKNYEIIIQKGKFNYEEIFDLNNYKRIKNNKTSIKTDFFNFIQQKDNKIDKKREKIKGSKIKIKKAITSEIFKEKDNYGNSINEEEINDNKILINFIKNQNVENNKIIPNDYGKKKSSEIKIKDKILFEQMSDKSKYIKSKNFNERRRENKTFSESMKRKALSIIKLYFPINIMNRSNISQNNILLNLINIVIMFSLIILSNHKSINNFYFLSNKNDEIILEINQKGVKDVINPNYKDKINSVYINGEYREKSHRFNLTETKNNIILNFYSLTSCADMFNSVKIESIKIYIYSQVSNINNMFYNCGCLNKITVYSFNTKRDFEANNLFFSCTNLRSIDLNWLNFEKISSMTSMFKNCKSLESISNFNLGPTSVTKFDDLFSGCSSLKSINLANLNNNNFVSTSGMFRDCHNLQSIEFPQSFELKVTDMEGMFSQCSSLTKINFSWLSSSNLKNINSIFSGCSKLILIDNLNKLLVPSVETMNNMFNGCSQLKSIDLSGFQTTSLKNMNYMFANCISLTSVNLTGFVTSKVNSMNGLFKGCLNIDFIDFPYLNTSSLKNISEIFEGCKNLTSVNFKHFDTSNVEDMSYMFKSCENLESIDLSVFNTTKVKYMKNFLENCINLTSYNLEFNSQNVETFECFFCNCQKLTSIELPKLKTDSMTNINSMFKNCASLTSVDFRNFDSSKVTTMNELFMGCSSLKSINFLSLDTTSLRSIKSMFRNCSNLTSVNFKNFDTSKVIDMSYMFESCPKLEKLDLSDNLKINSLQQMNNMFENCINLKSTNFFNQPAPDIKGMSNIFHSCIKLTSIDLSNLNPRSINNIDNIFNNCTELIFFKLPNFKNSTIDNMTNMFKDCKNLTSLDLSDLNTSNIITMNSMFSGCSKLTELNLKNFDTSKVTDMSRMFSNCEKLKSINIETFDTSMVNNMEKMFYNCKNIKSLNIANFNTSDVYDTSYMFSGCSKLTTLNLINFDTSNIQNMKNMFEDCSSLKSLDLSSFNTSTVSDMSYLFRSCNNLEYLEIYDFNTSNVNNMQYMFSGCNNLKGLDLSKFETKKCQNMEGMLSNCTNLEYLDLSNFNTQLVTNMESMFSGCSNLLYLDLNSFNFTIVRNISYMFKNCSSLVYLNFGKSSNQISINNNGSTDIFYNIFRDINICSKLNNIDKIDGIDKIISNYNLSLNCSHECFTNKANVLGSIKKCVENCQENDVFKYEYNNVCMKKCPFGSHHIYQKEYLCQKDLKCKEFRVNIEKCENNLLTGYYLDYNDGIYKPCYRACKTCNTSGDIYNNNCIEYLIDLYLEEFRSEVISYDTKKIDMGNDFSKSLENAVYTLTSTENQKNNQYLNVSSIDLNECQKKIIEEYGLPNNSNIYILKVDISLPGAKIPKIEYELYYPLNGKNLELLNMSVCENTKIDIYLPTNISYEELYKHNPKSDFYNDICKTHTSKSGTDIILNDRRNEFVDNNMTICEEDCELISFKNIGNTTINRIKCTCNTKLNLPKLSSVKIDKIKLLNNFKDIKNMININVLKCIKLLFNLNNAHKNYANYMMILLFILSIVSIFIFIFKDYSYTKKIIKYLLKEKLIYNKMYSRNNIITEKEKREKNKNISEYIPSMRNKFIKLNIKNIFFKKINNKIDRQIQNFIKLKNALNFRRSNKNHKYNQKSIKGLLKKYKRKIHSKSIKDKTNHLEENNIRKTILDKIKKKIKFRYNDNEINLLNYKDAKKIDKRTFLQYYFSLLKTKHLIFFSFFNFDDYNSSIIKIYIFFFNILIEYTISALFYTEEEMHKIYEDEGTFDILYQIPRMLYSSLLSLLFTNLIGNLGLYEENILNIKHCKYFMNNKTIKKILKHLKIKIVIFFSISYILLFCFWIYIGCFCAVYKNTQMHLLIEVLSSFGMSFIAPLFIYLIPGILRILSLKDGRNSNKPLLYKFSKIIQFFL